MIAVYKTTWRYIAEDSSNLYLMIEFMYWPIVLKITDVKK
jgi:hypothetical protein